MGRQVKDMEKDLEALSRIKVGDKVKYRFRKEEGVVSKITRYDELYPIKKGCRRQYYNYSSVTIKFPDGKHINASPRNVLLVEEI